VLFSLGGLSVAQGSEKTRALFQSLGGLLNRDFAPLQLFQNLLPIHAGALSGELFVHQIERVINFLAFPAGAFIGIKFFVKQFNSQVKKVNLFDSAERGTGRAGLRKSDQPNHSSR
jgi:hypothetical protein